MPYTINVSTGEMEWFDPPSTAGADFIKKNPDLLEDPNVNFDMLLGAAREKGAYIPPNGGMIELSTGPNMLWHLDPVARKAYRTNELQPGVPWGADPNNDTFSGKDGAQDLAKIAAMFGAAYGGGALLGGEAAAGAGAGAVGDAAIATGAGTDALAGGATTLGGGLSSGATATGIGGGATGTGLTAGSTATGIGGGATGTGIGTAASGAMAPGYFAAESLYPVGGGATGAAGSFGGSGTASGSGGMSDVASAALRALPGVLGAVGSYRQAGSLEDMQRRYEDYGAPSRARFEASMSPGFDPTSIPGYSGALDTASKGILARLSANGGNPFGNPGGLIDAQKQVIAGTALPAVQEFQRLNAGTGFGTTLNAAGGFGSQAIGAQGNVYNAIGAGINDVMNPPKTLAEQLAELKRAGLYTSNSLA